MRRGCARELPVSEDFRQNHLHDHKIRIRELSGIRLVDRINDLLQQSLRLSHYRGRFWLRRIERRRLLVQRDGARKRLFEFVVLELHRPFEIDDLVRVRGKQVLQIRQECMFLLRFGVEKPRDLRQVIVPADERADGASEQRTLLLLQRVVFLHHRTESSGYLPLHRQTLPPRDRKMNAVYLRHIAGTVERISADFLQLLEHEIDVYLFGKIGLLIVRLEGLFDLSIRIDEIENVGIDLAGVYTVDA